MRFLHAADLHLDSPLRAQALKNAALADELRLASRRVLGRIVDLAISHDVAAVLLAGDIFDSGVVDVTSRAALAAEMARLGRAGIQAVMIQGNHDALLDFERFGPVAGNVTMLHTARPSLTLDGVAIHGLGFEARHMADSLLPRYPQPEPGMINIGLMHTSLGGSVDHDPYAPCAEADLLAHGYDYWALGHIHQRFTRRGEGCLAVMPGIPQGRSIRETQGGSVTLVTLDADGPRAQALPVELMRFARIAVDLSADGNPVDLFSQALDAAHSGDAILAARLVVTGAGQLAGDHAFAQSLAEEAAQTLHHVYIEGLRFAVDPARTAPGVLSDLSQMMAEDMQTAGFRDAADAALDDWQRALPREIADVLGAHNREDLLAAGLAQLVQRLATATDT